MQHKMSKEKEMAYILHVTQMIERRFLRRQKLELCNPTNYKGRCARVLRQGWVSYQYYNILST